MMNQWCRTSITTIQEWKSELKAEIGDDETSLNQTKLGTKATRVK